jgi:hypothetical protein
MIKGTRISVPLGTIAIEDIIVGDVVSTPDGTSIVSSIRVKESNRTVEVTLHTHYTGVNFTLIGDLDEEIFTLPSHNRKLGNLHRINMVSDKTQVLKVDIEYNKRIPTYLLTLDGGDYYLVNGVKVRSEHGTR